MPLHALVPYFTRKRKQTYRRNISRWNFRIPIYMENWVKLPSTLSFTGNFFSSEKFSVTRPTSENNWKLLFLMTKRFSSCKMHNCVPFGSIRSFTFKVANASRIVVIIRSGVISRFYRSSDNLHRHNFFFGAITRRSSTQVNDSDAWWCNNGFLFTPGARKLLFDMRSQVENLNGIETSC